MSPVSDTKHLGKKINSEWKQFGNGNFCHNKDTKKQTHEESLISFLQLAQLWNLYSLPCNRSVI